jgi:hypothetical protein
MNNSVAYRETAEVCAKLADDVEDPYTKLVLLNLAEGWLRLANYAELRERSEVGKRFSADGSFDQDVNQNGQ